MCLGIPGKIIEIDSSSNILMAKIDFGGVIREACIQAIPDAKIGDYTIVHAGFALNIISPEDAAETLRLLNEITALDDELSTDRSQG
ncbi:MAG: HypC/HybG/HupF family hydrogenase formation chaperone [Anaerolineaceae bacterium]|jgi:hydrogenase expression/formation protein HypC